MWRKSQNPLTRSMPTTLHTVRSGCATCADTVCADTPAARLAGLLDAIGEAYMIADAQWRLTALNRHAAQLFGHEAPAQLLGASVFDLHPDFERSVFFEVCTQAMREGRAGLRTGYSASTGRWLLVRAYPFEGGSAIVANDITELAQERERLSFLAAHDPLTALPNRRALHDAIEAALLRGNPFSVAFLDLDRFKAINDTAGHTIGDLVLMEMASRLKLATPAGQRLYRLGGDEFVLLCEGDPSEHAAAAQQLLAASARPVKVGSAEFFLGASGGIASHPADGATLDELMRRADMAMYAAKRHSRGGLVLYDASLEAEARRKVAIEQALHRALDAGALELHYQPKVHARTHALVGVEALLRWTDAGLGAVPPNAFLPVAVECGLMARIDEWVVGRAVRDAAVLAACGMALPVAINLSAQSLCSPDTASRVGAELARHAMPASALEVEITETSLMQDLAASRATLEALRAIGVKAGVDDFGTGYSSLAYLTLFPVSTLKIDRGFVAQMVGDERSRQLVRGIVGLAHSLGMEVVAEGVESDEQAQLLAALDCDVLQGWAFARAMRLDELVAFARRSTIHRMVAATHGAM